MAAETFSAILHAAAESRWCVSPGCTTCGANDYRSALDRAIGVTGDGLNEELASLTRSDIEWFSQWPDALAIACLSIPFPDDVLSSWMAKMGRDVRFDDVVTFQIVRGLRRPQIRTAWLERAVPVAVEADDFSFVESLILVLKIQALKHPSLVDTAREMGRTSGHMRRVLRNACGVEIPEGMGDPR